MSPGELSQNEIDALLSRAAERARKASEAEASRAATARQPAAGKVAPDEEAAGALENLLDVPLDVRVRLGEAVMPIEDILKLREGSAIELDRSPGEPVDILVNDLLVARGEVVVIDDRFSVRVTEIVAGASRPGEEDRGS